MITLYTASGTWADMWTGYPADVARGLVGEWDRFLAEITGTEPPPFYWQPIGYPASFGPVAPPVPNAPSYAESVRIGVAEGIRLINSRPGRFILIGYSQGAEVTMRILKEVLVGSLAHRRGDCEGHIGFGNPARQAGVGGPAGGSGISGLVLPASSTPMLEYANKGDMYCTTPEGKAGENMRAVYQALTHMFDGDILTAIIGQDGLAEQVFELLGNPVIGIVGVVDALIRLAQFAATNAHAKYEWAVADAVARLRVYM